MDALKEQRFVPSHVSSAAVSALYHESKYKKRFCATFPNSSQCHRGDCCAFAHSREEMRSPLLSVEEEQQLPRALTRDFWMSKYKTLWCPVGMQHDWQSCSYAHNYQDARRPVSIGYSARPCPYWNRKEIGGSYSQRCPFGLRCPYSHGAKEQLYHPQYFRTAVCRDHASKRCPRGIYCAFFHKPSQRRTGAPDDVDHSKPLPQCQLPEGWAAEFLAPPFPSEEGAAVQENDGEVPLGPYSNLPWFEPTFISSPTALWSSEHDLKSRDFDEPAFVDFKLRDEEPAFVHVPGLEKQFGGAKSLGTESTSSGEEEEENSLGNDIEVFAAGTWPDAAPYIPWGCTAHQPYAPDFSDFSQLPLWNSALEWNGAWWPNVGEDSLLCNEVGF